MFTKLEEKAIKEKLKQLKKVKDGSLTPKKLADLITKRRASWFLKNKKDVLVKYENLPDEEKAYRIIFFDHMKINPQHSKMVRVGDKK